MCVHKWSDVWKLGEPHMVGLLGVVGQTRWHYTGQERCRKCGKRQDSRAMARAYSYCAAAVVLGVTLLLAAAHAGPGAFAVSFTVGLFSLLGGVTAHALVRAAS